MKTLEGRYRLVEQLGKGGFGAVWLAYDERSASLCAVKQCHAGSPDLIKLLEAEAALLANLRHPGLPRIRDHFADDEGAYLVMDYIEGGDLGMLLATEPRGLPPLRVAEWTTALSDAIQYLHTLPEPVLHRDIKPSNVKLTPDGRVVLIDFGIAREATAATMGLQHAITPGYSPPEQYRGAASTRSDVYALAATVYALLTGQAPLPAPERLAGAPLPPPSALRPHLPQALDAPILAALDLDPEGRPATPTQFASGFQQAVAQATRLLAATRAAKTAMLPATKPGRRRPNARIWMLALATLILLIASGTWIMLARLDRGSALAGAGAPWAAGDPTAPAATSAPPTPTVPTPTSGRPSPQPTAPPLVAGIDGTLYLGQRETDGDYQIYRLPANGAPPRRLTSDGSNYGGLLSPDGGQIAFTSERDGREQIYLMGTDGANQRRVSADGGLAQYPSWSPDGRSLAYSYNPDPDAAQDDDNWRIVIQPIDGGAAERVANIWGSWPTWGPHGIVFTSREVVDGYEQLSLSLVQPDGSGLRVLNPTRDRDEHYPQWSPDGAALLYVAGDSRRPATRQVWAMDADGGNAHPITTGIGGVAMPTWSPDGTWIAFLARWGGAPTMPDGRTQFNIWIAPADGGAAKPFTVSDSAKFGLGWGR